MRLSPAISRLPHFRTLIVRGPELVETDGPAIPCPPFGWGLCEFASTYGYAVWDGVGLMALEVGFAERRQSACAAVAALRSLGCDCAASFLPSDEGATRLARAAANGGEIRLHLPISDFQLAVYRLAAAAPPGRTLTYGTIAALLGHPRSARAVARALASNKAALAIPCHRVVPACGGAGGWRWGRHLKELVLEAEAAGNPAELVAS